MDEKTILNNGFGSPGDSSRAMTREFMKFKLIYGKDTPLIFRKILSDRSMIYKSMGFNILDEKLINKIILESDSCFPYVILADIYVTNKIQSVSHSRAMLQYLNQIIEVVLENYNLLVAQSDKYEDNITLKIRILEFIGIESKVFGINESNKNTYLTIGSLYVSQKDDYASCLKFFNDGIVISASVNGDVINSKSTQNDINEWFDKSYHIDRGCFKIENNKIVFSTFSNDGAVSYDGVVITDRLDLDVHSQINGFRYKEIYIKT